MRRYMQPSSFRLWRKRVTGRKRVAGRKTKHQHRRDFGLGRSKSSNQK